jgi:hypothetical protein
MIKMPAKGLAVLATCCAMFGAAHAADPLPAQTQIVAASTAVPPAAPPTQRTFHISPTTTPPPDLVVTLTDLKIPAELASAGVVVTQAGAIAGSAQLTAPATNASVSLPAASGDFTIAVFGVPVATPGVGTFSVCVAPKSDPSNCIIQTGSQTAAQSPSFTGNITVQSSPTDATISTLSTPLNVTTAGSYTFTFADLQFPVPLNPNTTPTPNPSVALFQGITPIIPPGQTTPGITSGTAITLSPGQYNLLSIAQADPTVKQGLYSITITAPDGVTTLLNTAVPVGLLSAPTRCPNSTAQSVTLTVSDFLFPAPLASASALVTAGATTAADGTYLPGGTYVGRANSGGGAQSLAAPAENLTLWTYGSMGASNAGTFSADVAGTSDLCTAAQGVGPSGTTFAYAFVVPTPLTAGAYQATAADLQFPAQLSGLQFAVAQNGNLKVQPVSASTVSFNAVAGNAVLLVSAQTPASGGTSSNGLFDVNLQSTGASASLVYDKTQIVSSTGGLFSAQTVTVADNASYDANLTDLKFPAAFDSLGLVVSRGSSVVGKIFGGGKPLSFAGSPGTYQLTFVATPSANQKFGLYASSVVYSPPTITLSSNVTSAAVGANIQLTWSATNASTCSASGGNWSGNKATSATTESVLLAATTTYVLNCTGLGGATTQSVTVTATAAPAKSGGGGGALDLGLLALCGGLVTARFREGRAARSSLTRNPERY